MREGQEETASVAAVPEVAVLESTPDVEALFQAHHGRVFAAAYRVTGNANDAEDVLQTVFLRLLRRETTPDLSPSPEAYLHRAAVNAALDLLRQKRRAASVPIDVMADALHDSGDAGPEEQWRESELMDWLRGALARLSPQAAEVFALHCFEGLGNDEIAQQLGLSRSAVGVLIHRSRRRLREELRTWRNAPHDRPS